MRKNIYKYKLEDSHNPRVTGKVVMPLSAEILSCAMFFDCNKNLVWHVWAAAGE